MNIKLLLVGVILITLGTTLLATSYFKIYDTVETIFPTADVLPIKANSSSDFHFDYSFGPLPQSQKILVVVAGSQELQGILNSTLNYNSIRIGGGKNITISLSVGNHSISASETTNYYETYEEAMTFHIFDIPVSWWNGFDMKVSITNPENYPVCWIVNVMLYGQVVNNNWLTVFLVGIVLTILGLIIIEVAHHRRRAITKQ
jgi:uncharacterized membrane protein